MSTRLDGINITPPPNWEGPRGIEDRSYAPPPVDTLQPPEARTKGGRVVTRQLVDIERLFDVGCQTPLVTPRTINGTGEYQTDWSDWVNHMGL